MFTTTNNVKVSTVEGLPGYNVNQKEFAPLVPSPGKTLNKFKCSSKVSGPEGGVKVMGEVG